MLYASVEGNDRRVNKRSHHIDVWCHAYEAYNTFTPTYPVVVVVVVVVARGITS